MIETQKLIIAEQYANKRIDRVLWTLFKQIPLSAIYKAFRSKKIFINGKPVKQDCKTQEGDLLEFFIPDKLVLPKSNYSKYKHLEQNSSLMKKLEILYEDADLLILNKPAGISVHGGSGQKEGLNMLVLAACHVKSDTFSLTPIHRLDKPTSGILVFAKTNKALQNLNEQLRNKTTIKKYLALVEGDLDRDHGIIDDSLVRTDSLIKKTKWS